MKKKNRNIVFEISIITCMSLCLYDTFLFRYFSQSNNSSVAVFGIAPVHLFLEKSRQTYTLLINLFIHIFKAIPESLDREHNIIDSEYIA